jgi:hypothetical protein
MAAPAHGLDMRDARGKQEERDEHWIHISGVS